MSRETMVFFLPRACVCVCVRAHLRVHISIFWQIREQPQLVDEICELVCAGNQGCTPQKEVIFV